MSNNQSSRVGWRLAPVEVHRILSEDYDIVRGLSAKGGQAIPAFDFFLAPFVKMTYEEEISKIEETNGAIPPIYKVVGDYEEKDVQFENGYAKLNQLAINRTVRRIKQTMEAFVHNMNTIHSRGGNQVTFSSINYGTDTSAEGRCIIRELLKTTYEGVGNGSTAIFPIQIWKLKSGVSAKEGDPNYDLLKLACKVTARRFFPNFVNLDATFNQHEKWDANDPERYQYEVATMGCRTRVFENRFGPKTSIGRGNLSFTTINLPKIALSVMSVMDENRRIEVFMNALKTVVNGAAQQLDERFQFQKTALKKQFPLLMSKLWVGSERLSNNDTIESVINQGTLGIGFIGLAECLVALVGKHHGESDKAQKLGLKIVEMMRDLSVDASVKYQHNYAVLATPAEGLAGKFVKRDRDMFGVVNGVTDKDYYTNSNHVPVWYKCSVKHKAEIEAPYHELTKGGHIFYIELDGDATHNPQSILRFTEILMEHNMGYGSVNHTRARCPQCGYETSDDIHQCPECGNTDMDIIQRITGYIVSSLNNWNNGKRAELRDRVTHN